MASEGPSPDAAASSPADTVTINIKAPGDTKLSITIDKAQTALDLKKAIADKTEPRVEPENQRLIYSGRVLKDDQSLSEYKIQTGHSVHMVKGAARSANAPSTSAQVPTNINAGQNIAGNPLAPLLNATNQIPAFNPFADLGMNPNDPNLGMNMLNSPDVMNQMQRMLDDPAVLDQIISSSPELANLPGIREMLRDPNMRRMIFNPEMMRMAMQARQGAGGGGAVFPPPGAFGIPSTGPRANPNPSGAGQPGTQAQSPPAFNPFDMFGGLGAGGAGAGQGQDVMALLNSPHGRMAMQQMMAGGGPFGAGGLGAFGGAGGVPPAPVDTRPPEERFEVQLGQLQGMGFTNARQNIQALQASGGSVEAAIEYILSGN